MKNAVTLNIGLGVRQGHWKYHRSIERMHFLLTFYSNYGSISCCFWDIQCRKNVVTLKSGSVTQGHWKWYHSVDRVWCTLVIVSITHRFWDIRLVSIQWPWNPG